MGYKKVDYEIKKRYKIIRQMIEQHGKVRVVFVDAYYDVGLKKWTKTENFRRRILNKDGHSKVSYKSAMYTKWSGYGVSCFINGENVTHFKEMLKLMKRHDQCHIQPVEVQYGWFFRKRVAL